MNESIKRQQAKKVVEIVRKLPIEMQANVYGFVRGMEAAVAMQMGKPSTQTKRVNT